jgi:predicted enzyme related to lactoylglutathione lyase
MAHVIDYIEFAVDDLEQSKAFYAKALGWAFNDYGPDYAGIKDPRTGGSSAG